MFNCLPYLHYGPHCEVHKDNCSRIFVLIATHTYIHTHIPTIEYMWHCATVYSCKYTNKRKLHCIAGGHFDLYSSHWIHAWTLPTKFAKMTPPKVHDTITYRRTRLDSTTPGRKRCFSIYVQIYIYSYTYVSVCICVWAIQNGIHPQPSLLLGFVLKCQSVMRLGLFVMHKRM